MSCGRETGWAELPTASAKPKVESGGLPDPSFSRDSDTLSSYRSGERFRHATAIARRHRPNVRTLQATGAVNRQGKQVEWFPTDAQSQNDRDNGTGGVEDRCF